MGILFLTREELLTRVSDYLDEDVTTANRSFYEKRSGRTVRLANQVLKELGRSYPLRQEEFRFTGDGATEFYHYPADLLYVEDVIINNNESTEISYPMRKKSESFVTTWDGFVNNHYKLPEGVGFYPVLTTGTVGEVIARTHLPTLREEATTVTAATWTNGDETVSGISPALTEGTNVGKGNGILGPDGRVYRISSLNSSSSLELTERYGGTTVTGATGASTIGGHVYLDSNWHEAVVLGTTAKLCVIDKPEKAQFFAQLYQDNLGAAQSAADQSYGNQFSR